MHNLKYLLLGVLVLAVGFYYGQEIISLFKKFSLETLLYLVLLHIPLIAAGGLAFDCLAKPYHIQLAFRDWLGLSFIANLLNQFLPYRPGMGLRFWYLKKHYHFKAPEFIIIMLVYLVLTVSMSALFTLIGWIQIRAQLPQELNQFLLLASSIGIGIILLWFFFRKKKKIPALLLPVLNAPYTLCKAFAIMGVINLLTTLIFYKVFSAVGAPLAWSHCVFLVGICTLGMIFPLTPGNIGVLETLAGTLTLLLYNDFALGFSAIVLYRTSQWIPSLVLGTFFSFLLLGSVFPPTRFSKPGSIQDS